MTKNYQPKISFNVSQEVYNAYMNGLDWGLRGRLMTEITTQLLKAIELHGLGVAYMILARKISLFGLPQEKSDG